MIASRPRRKSERSQGVARRMRIRKHITPLFEPTNNRKLLVLLHSSAKLVEEVQHHGSMQRSTVAMLSGHEHSDEPLAVRRQIKTREIAGAQNSRGRPLPRTIRRKMLALGGIIDDHDPIVSAE